MGPEYDVLYGRCLRAETEVASLKAERDQFKALADGEKKLREIFELDAGALRSELANTVNWLAECRDQLSQAQAKVEKLERVRDEMPDQLRILREAIKGVPPAWGGYGEWRRGVDEALAAYKEVKP